MIDYHWSIKLLGRGGTSAVEHSPVVFTEGAGSVSADMAGRFEVGGFAIDAERCARAAEAGVGLGVGAFDVVFRGWMVTTAEYADGDLLVLEGAMICRVVEMMADAAFSE